MFCKNIYSYLVKCFSGFQLNLNMLFHTEISVSFPISFLKLGDHLAV